MILLAGLLPFAGGCADGPADLDYEVMGAFPHDRDAYTQGLLVHGQDLIESTGRYGESTLRRVDIATGEVLNSVALDSMYFGEGLALVGDEVFQLTWKSGKVFVRDVATFEVLREHDYEGEGWGLCHDGTSLWMSNGTDRLAVRDPNTFQISRQVSVTSRGIPVRGLNELECVGEFVWANVFQTDRIVKIERATGIVVGELDATDLALRAPRPADVEAVLNGIAYIEESGVFLITGKLWPQLFAIRIRE